MSKKTISITVVAALVLAIAPAAQAMEFVTIGNPGNAGELSGAGAGGAGPDRIVGAVDYTYLIGKYEVTAAEWAEAIAADPNVGDAGSGSGNEPAGNVHWHEAARFCNWMTTGDALLGYYIITDGAASIPAQTHHEYAQANGLTYFLPTEDEWYKAAYYDPGGSVYYDYPTGSDTIPTAEGPAGTDLINGSANYARAVGSRTIGGAYSSKPSDSPYGTFDQGGNMWEWCEDWIEPGPGPLQRGGGWIATGDTLMSNKRWSAGSSYEQPPDAGFRVSALGVVTDVPGDANGDRIVDVFDLDRFEEQFGGTPGVDSADFDDDGDIDIHDFATMRGNWQFGVGGAPLPAAATPEPATAALLVLGLAILKRRRRS